MTRMPVGPSSHHPSELKWKLSRNEEFHFSCSLRKFLLLFCLEGCYFWWWTNNMLKLKTEPKSVVFSFYFNSLRAIAAILCFLTVSVSVPPTPCRRSKTFFGSSRNRNSQNVLDLRRVWEERKWKQSESHGLPTGCQISGNGNSQNFIDFWQGVGAAETETVRNSWTSGRVSEERKRKLCQISKKRLPRGLCQVSL